MAGDGNATGRLPASIRAMRTVAGGLQSARTRALLDYWKALPAVPGGVPLRRAVDPIAIGPALLPHVFLCVFLDDEKVQIRLQGSYIEEEAGQPMAGRMIDADSFGVNAPAMLDVYRAVRILARPIATHETVLTSVYRTILTEVLHLPLCDEDGNLTYVLGAMDRLDHQRLPSKEFFAAEWATIRIVEDV